MDLSTKQYLVLDYIKRFIAEKNYSPTIREIMIGLALRSPSTVHEHLKNLANKGIITYNPGKSRTIELLVENEYLIEQRIINIKLVDKDDYICVPEFMLNTYDVKYLVAFKQDKSIYIINTSLKNIRDKKALYKDKEEYIISKNLSINEIGAIVSEFKLY